ncbi:MAG TPA: hypothetical protein VFU79_03560 [Nitrososphaeraceae archaeon]|nr:hypothetical protein [Nitrososphaeraceae archaeon]
MIATIVYPLLLHPNNDKYRKMMAVIASVMTVGTYASVGNI